MDILTGPSNILSLSFLSAISKHIFTTFFNYINPKLHNGFQSAPHHPKIRKNFSLTFTTFFSHQRHSFFLKILLYLNVIKKKMLKSSNFGYSYGIGHISLLFFTYVCIIDIWLYINYLFYSYMFIFEDVVLDTKNTALIKQINGSHFPVWDRQ